MSESLGRISAPAAAQCREHHRFLDVGVGPVPVVLLHGLFGSPENWRPIMNDLAASHRLLALQLPIDHNGGRQHSSFRSIGQLTDYVVDCLDELCVDRAVLCGNSLGGQVAIDFCLRYPQRVEKLVLSGSAGLFERSLSGGRSPRLSRELIQQQACGIFHDPVHVTDDLVDDIYSMLNDRGYRRFLLRVAKATRDRYTLDELARVHVPTLIIWGQNDSITPPFVAEQFCSAMRCAQLVYIEHCGHAPPIEQPQEFARLLRDFLADTAGCRRIVHKPR